MTFLKFMANWGIWDIVGLIAAIVPTFIVLLYLFPRKSITNLYIDTKRGSINQAYPKVMLIIIRNHTNNPIYVLSEGFTFGDTLTTSPNAAKNTATQVCEVKFEGRQINILSEIDTLIRPGQQVSTWIPINPSLSDQEIDVAIQSRSVGILRLKCERLSGRRDAPIRMKIPL